MLTIWVFHAGYQERVFEYRADFFIGKHAGQRFVFLRSKLAVLVKQLTAWFLQVVEKGAN